jgi:hypothetical protein
MSPIAWDHTEWLQDIMKGASFVANFQPARSYSKVIDFTLLLVLLAGVAHRAGITRMWMVMAVVI